MSASSAGLTKRTFVRYWSPPEEILPMSAEPHGRITDDGIAKLKTRIGQGFPGRRPWRADCYLKSLTEKDSAFGGGRALYQTYEALYYDQDGARVGLRNDTWIRIERTKTREKKKYGDITLAQWKPDDIARFQDEYRRYQ